MSEANGSEPVLCPSATCEEGALLLGVVQHEGTVAFFPEKMPVDREFVAIANEGTAPEKRFRFAGRCLKSCCKQWTGTRCGVIDNLMQQAPVDETVDLPECSIR